MSYITVTQRYPYRPIQIDLQDPVQTIENFFDMSFLVKVRVIYGVYSVYSIVYVLLVYGNVFV